MHKHRDPEKENDEDFKGSCFRLGEPMQKQMDPGHQNRRQQNVEEEALDEWRPRRVLSERNVSREGYEGGGIENRNSEVSIGKAMEALLSF